MVVYIFDIVIRKHNNIMFHLSSFFFLKAGEKRINIIKQDAFKMIVFITKALF